VLVTVDGRDRKGKCKHLSYAVVAYVNGKIDPFKAKTIIAHPVNLPFNRR